MPNFCPTIKPWVVAVRYIRDKWTSTWNALTGKRSYAEIQKETIKFRRTGIRVHFVGVWDTVASYGLPVDELTQAVDKWVWPMTFSDKTLLGNVENARQALSLEDDRRTFHPIPWDETAEKNLAKSGAVKPGRLRQVWFAGAHADVGGGYPDDGLSFVALGWMIGEAADKGLRFMPSVVAEFVALATPTGRIYDPRSGLGALWRYQPREAQLLLGQGNTPLVHGSVMTRIVCGTEGYAPISLPQNINVLPPYGPPVAFGDLQKALAEADPGGKALSRDALENQRLVLKNSLTVATETGKLPQRTDLFDLVLDTVWWRRINYFVSLGFVLIAAAFPLLVGHRAAFDLLSAGGAYCTAGMTDLGEEKLGSSPFETNSMCRATGLRLVEGGTYRIRLDMDEGADGEWFDKDRRTDVAGFAADSVRHVMALPLKRWWFQNWFQPIARIGDVGNYEHVLRPAAPLPVVDFRKCSHAEEKRLSGWEADIPSPASEGFKQTELACEASDGIKPSRTLISDITADATGELFIYVNDAVLALPGLKDVFYRNNSGTSKVTVTRVLADSIIETPAKGIETPAKGK